MGYSRSISNYKEIITLFDMANMMNVSDFVAIIVETIRIYSECYLDNEIIELIYMNPLMVLYLIVNRVDSCHYRVCDFFT